MKLFMVFSAFTAMLSAASAVGFAEAAPAPAVVDIGEMKVRARGTHPRESPNNVLRSYIDADSYSANLSTRHRIC